MRSADDDEDEPNPDTDIGSNLPFNSGAGDTELSQLKDSLKITLRCLATFAKITDHPAPLDFYASTLQRPASYKTKCEDLVEGKFPDAPKKLKERLVDTMLIRREYLDYREAQTKQHQRVSTSVTGERTHSKPSTSEVVLLDEESSTESTKIELEIGTNLPPVHLGEPFQCPLCFLRISVPNNKSWRCVQTVGLCYSQEGLTKYRKHVMEDLCPYICTFDQCGAPLNRFASRRSWFAHEMEHVSKWKCPESCEEDFDTKRALIFHLKDVHDWITRAEIPGGIAEACKVLPEGHSRIRCPLCQNEVCVSELQDHLGQHQEYIAFFALRPQIAPTEFVGHSAASTVRGNRDYSSIESHTCEYAPIERGHSENSVQEGQQLLDMMLPSLNWPPETTEMDVPTDANRQSKGDVSNRATPGCQTCKLREKKCDETQPICRNCTLGGFVCEGYLIATRYHRNTRPTYKEYGRHTRQSSHLPSFLYGASTLSTDLGPPTPTHELTYARVTRPPEFDQDFFPLERKRGSHHKKHRRHEPTMNPPQGTPKGPPQGPLHSVDADSDSERSRHRNRRPPPIDLLFPATNVPTVVRNYSSTSGKCILTKTTALELPLNEISSQAKRCKMWLKRSPIRHRSRLPTFSDRGSREHSQRFCHSRRYISRRRAQTRKGRKGEGRVLRSI